jgi:hypothetical protein
MAGLGDRRKGPDIAVGDSTRVDALWLPTLTPLDDIAINDLDLALPEKSMVSI